MPTRSKSTELLLLEGKSHLTKAEIAYRQSVEKYLSTKDNMFFEQPRVKADKIAHQEFMRLRRLYGKIEFVESLDQQIINRYCLEVSSTQQLQDVLARLSIDLDVAAAMEDRLRIYDLIHKVNVAMSKNKEMLLKLEDRLFLNPAARLKAVPKTPPKEEKQSGMAGFMAKRAEQ